MLIHLILFLLKKMLLFFNVKESIGSVLNDDQSHYDYNMFLEKS